MENPKIRFKGFTKDWEQRKLIDVCDYVDYRGKTPTKTDSGVFLVTAKNVKDGYIDYGASQEYISEDDYEEVMHRGKPEIGDVLITTEAPCGNVAQVNRADIALAQRIIKYRGQSNIVDNTYLKYYLLSPEFQDILNAKSSGGTVKGIKGSILHQQEIKYPKYEEQFKIGSYFNNLDHLITLHQRKCEQTKKLKKYMLQKMFPQNGAKVPEIRFDGFTYDWEQRKFGELYSKVSEKNDLSFGADKIISVANMYFKEEVKESSDEYMRTYNVMRLGDIAFEGNKSKNYSHGRFVENTIGDGIVSHVFDVFRPTTSYDLLFWKYLINNEGVMGRIMARCTNASTMMTNLVASDFLKEKILVPSLKEQKKIGAYFDSLDHLITLHQRKCDELKKMKKYMLQNMFI